MTGELVPTAGTRAVLPTPTAYLGKIVGDRKLRLGSRTSPMAMAQARTVASTLSALVPSLNVTIVGIHTGADQWQGDLAVLGGKGLFVKEIDRALLMGEVDVAIHCMKDVPGDVPLPHGVVFAAYLPREDIRDCMVFPVFSDRGTLAGLHQGRRRVRARHGMGADRQARRTRRVHRRAAAQEGRTRPDRRHPSLIELPAWPAAPSWSSSESNLHPNPLA